jgi:hypothetical protein
MVNKQSNVYHSHVVKNLTHHKLGISPESCLNYAYTPQGARNAVNVCSQAMGRMQSNAYRGFTSEEQFEAMDG